VRADAPLLLILHGLEGSSRSHYAVGLAREALAHGWRAVVLNFRSCSGELNRRPQFYHSGHTDDLDDVVRVLVDREPATRLAAVGVSLGGNVLLKWLGEREAEVPAQLVGAVAISVHGQAIDVAVHTQGDRVIVDVSAHALVKRDVAWSVLTDYDHMAEFVSDLKTSVVLLAVMTRREARKAAPSR